MENGPATIVVIGASGHAKVIIKPGAEVMGYRVVGSEQDVPALVARGDIIGGIAAIGHNWVRHEVVARIRSLCPEFRFVNAVHPSARIGRSVQLGQGIAIMAGVSVNPGTVVKDHCFLNTNASVDHDNVLEEYSCLQPNAVTGGNVRLGAFSAVSMGATVIQGVRIGSHTVIGAGSTVLSDIPDRVVAYGTPCRVVRPREPADNYY